MLVKTRSMGQDVQHHLQTRSTHEFVRVFKDLELHLTISDSEESILPWCHGTFLVPRGNAGLPAQPEGYVVQRPERYDPWEDC